MIDLPQMGRLARLTLISLGPPLVVNRILPGPGVAVNQARIEFRVVKSVSREANQSMISVFNLDRRSVDAALGIVRRPTKLVGPGGITAPIDQRFGITGDPILDTTAAGFAWVQLEAGYQPTPQGLFEGQAENVQTIRRGKDNVTLFEVGDAVLPLNKSLSNLSYEPGTPVLTCVRYLAGCCGLRLMPTPAIPLLAADISTGTGWYVQGRARDALEEIIDPFSFEWWVEDSQLWVVPFGTMLPGPPVVVSGVPAPGTIQLLGSPEPAENNGLRIRTLLAPMIRPGFAVSLVATQGTGTYRVQHVEHSGDNRGTNEFVTTAIIRDPLSIVPF